jgi:hypothetical protein
MVDDADIEAVGGYIEDARPRAQEAFVTPLLAWIEEEEARGQKTPDVIAAAVAILGETVGSYCVSDLIGSPPDKMRELADGLGAVFAEGFAAIVEHFQQHPDAFEEIKQRGSH